MMDNLAVVMVTCNKYSYLWGAWYHYYKANFQHSQQEYFISDSEECPFEEFTHLKYKTIDVNGWSGAIRGCIEKIPHDNIFFLLDDLFFNKPISNILQALNAVFNAYDMDSLRIIMKDSAATAVKTELSLNGAFIRQLKPNSKYLVSYVPNIFKRSVLLDFLSVNESPWSSEVKGSTRVRSKGYKIFDYHYPDWYVNSVVKGVMTPQGKLMLDSYNRKPNAI